MKSIFLSKVIAAEGEQKASRALREASDVIAKSSSALQLRYLQVSQTKMYSVLWSQLLIFKFYTDAELNIGREEFHGHIPSPNRPDNQLASREQGRNWCW